MARLIALNASDGSSEDNEFVQSVLVIPDGALHRQARISNGDPMIAPTGVIAGQRFAIAIDEPQRR